MRSGLFLPPFDALADPAIVARLLRRRQRQRLGELLRGANKGTAAVDDLAAHLIKSPQLALAA